MKTVHLQLYRQNITNPPHKSSTIAFVKKSLFSDLKGEHVLEKGFRSFWEKDGHYLLDFHFFSVRFPNTLYRFL